MKYTVVGVYREPLGQRFGTVVEAATPEEAEVDAHLECIEGNAGMKMIDVVRAGVAMRSGLMIAGVFEGEIDSLDTYTDGHSFGVPGQ